MAARLPQTAMLFHAQTKCARRAAKWRQFYYKRSLPWVQSKPSLSETLVANLIPRVSQQYIYITTFVQNNLMCWVHNNRVKIALCDQISRHWYLIVPVRKPLKLDFRTGSAWFCPSKRHFLLIFPLGASCLPTPFWWPRLKKDLQNRTKKNCSGLVSLDHWLDRRRVPQPIEKKKATICFNIIGNF